MFLNRSLVMLLCALALAMTQPSIAEEAPIGRIKSTSGTPTIVHNGVSRDAVLGGPIFQYDQLETDREGSLGIVFVDESSLSLGPDTNLIVDEYVFAPETNEGSFISRVTRGTLLYVSGLIAKVSPESVAVETPVGTIGIRGTRFMVKIEPEESA